MSEIYYDVDASLSEVPVNIFPLTDDTDFKSRETAIAYNATGMDLVWNFVSTSGAMIQTPVIPTSGGDYDWIHQGDGMYSIGIPSNSGASINNDSEGFGWFTGVCTGVLPWRSPIYCFRASGINDKLIDSAYDSTRGLAGTALPAAAADAAGGLPISDAGALDLDTLLTRLDAAISTRLASANYTAPNNSDIATILSRIIGTLATGTHNPQSGDAFNRIGAAGAGLTAIGDTRVANLDATVSSRSTLTAQQVWEYATRTLTSFGTLISDIWSYATRTLTAFSFSVTASSVTDKTGYSLSVTPPTAAQIRTEIDSNSTQLSAIKEKTDNLPSGIKKGVAVQNFAFVLKDSSDHFSGLTGATVSGYIKKDAGSFTALTGTITEVNYGIYVIDEISASEMNADILVLRFAATGADDCIMEIKTV